MASTRERTGVLVARLWIDGDAETACGVPHRNVDVENRENEMTTASSVEDIQATPRAWLAEFTGDEG